MPKEDVIPAEESPNNEKGKLDLSFGMFDIEKVNVAISAFSTAAHEMNLNLIEANHVFKSLHNATGKIIAEKFKATLEDVDHLLYDSAVKEVTRLNVSEETNGGEK